MTDFTSYLIISSVCLIFSYGVYTLVFKGKSSFGHQRFFLLISLVLSVLLPLTGIRFELPSLPAAIQDSTINLPLPGAGGDEHIPDTRGLLQSVAEFIPYIYIIVSTTFILLLILQIVKIFRLYIISEKSREGNLLILRCRKTASPFSFFSLVFIPEGITEKEEIESIIIHENVHSRDLHSIDNIITGLATGLMWFNPFAWLMKNSLQLVHEYVADEGTLKAGIEKTRYQILLLNQVSEAKLISIPSTFNNNLKKRIIMMTKINDKGHNRFRILSLVPVSMILSILVAVLNGVFIQDVNAQQQKKKNKNEKSKEITVTGYAMKPDTVNYIVDGVLVNNVSNLNPDSIESIDVLKTDRTIIVRTKSFAKKHVQEEQAPKTGVQVKTGPDKVLYIVDDRPITKEEMKNIDPNQIESMNVIKGKEQIKKYTQGDYDGVIIITSKK